MVLREAWSDSVPAGMGLRKAVKQQHRRPGTALAHEVAGLADSMVIALESRLGHAWGGCLPHVARQRSVGRELVLAPAAPRCGERDAVPALRAFAARPGEERGDQGEDHQHGHECDDDLEAHVAESILLTFVLAINPQAPSTATCGARRSTASNREPRIRRSSGGGPPDASD